MALFLDDENELEKEAGFSARLSEAPENWPQELSSELFKQMPFLSDYNVNVNLDRVEPNRGYAFGYADVANKTERPEMEHDEAGLPHIRVPLIVQERSVKPFSVFLDGEHVMPLTEDRVRETLFNPTTFDLSTSQPRDPSLVEPLMPPNRSGIGMGGEYKMASAPMTKEAIFGLSKHEKMQSDYIKAHNAWAEEMNEPHNTEHLNKVHQHILKTKHKTTQADADEDTYLSAYDEAHSTDPHLKSIHDKHFGEFKKKWGGHQKEGAAPGSTGGLSSDEMKQAWHTTQDKPKTKKAGIPKGMLQAHMKGSTNSYVTNRTTAHALGRGAGMASSTGEKIKQRASKSLSEMPNIHQGAGVFKGASLLERIAPTIRQSDVDAFTERLAADPSLVTGFKRSGIAPILIEALENTKHASADDYLETVAENIEPTVVTIHKLPGNKFLVKSANVNAFAGGPDAQGQVVDQDEAGAAMGDEQAQAMQPGQTVTAVSDPVANLGMPPSTAKVVDEFGEYKVQDTMGNQLLGWVFPNSLAWDGSFSPQPVAVFSNGSVYAVQEDIAGELVGKGTNLPRDTPRGDGVFYFVDGGSAVCTAPVTIGSSAAGPDGLPRFIGTDIFGNQVMVSFVEGLKVPQRISDTEFGLPDTWKFMRLNNQTQLAQDPSQFLKTAAAKLQSDQVTLFYNGAYNVTGGCGLNKIASEYKQDLDAVGAEFVLGLLGVDGATVKVKVAEARKKGSVKLANLHTIQTFGERYQEATKTASSLLARLPDLRRDLIKEAAALEDESTVDKVLALNFINPDNIAEFVNSIPELEKTSESLAEMLLYSYIGAKEIPEGATERAMRNMEEVILGLKALQHAES